MVPGGGVALISAIPYVEKTVKGLSGDEKTGAQIILKALMEPIKQIALNAGVDGNVVINTILTKGKNKSNYG